MSNSSVPNLEVWCREFPAGASTDAKALRGRALASVATNYTAKNIELLLRLAFGLSVSAIPSAVTEFRAALRSVDLSFAESGNDYELQVMAAAVISTLAADEESQAAQVATRCLTTSFGKLRALALPVDLPAFAQQRVVVLGGGSRKRLELKRSVGGLTGIKYSAVTDAEFNATGVTNAIKASIDSTVAGVSAGIKAAFNQSSVLRSLAVLEEELQVLWWLTNGWSTSLDVAFSKVPKTARPLVFARELSDHTDIFPETPSLRGLLNRTGVGTTAIEIVEAVNHLDRDWAAQTLQGKEPSAFTTPLHLALQRRLETQDDKAWGTGWASAVGIPLGSTLSALDLGIQMYREASILKSR